MRDREYQLDSPEHDADTGDAVPASELPVEDEELMPDLAALAREDERQREQGIQALQDELARTDDVPADQPPLSTDSEKVEQIRQVSVAPDGVAQVLQRDRLNVYGTNARHILGPDASDQDVAGLARRTFREYMRALTFSARPRSRESLREMTDVVGQEHLQQTLDERGRAVVVSAHMAYFPTGMRMIPDLLPEHSRGTTIVERNPLWPIVNAARKVAGLFGRGDTSRAKFDMMVKDSKNPSTLHSIIRRLQSGTPDQQREILFMAADRGDLSPDRRRTAVDFFDSRVNFPTGPATIARHANAPIIPSAIVRQGDRLTVRLGQPIALDAGQDPQQADQAAMQQVADFFAQQIQEHPDQWPVYRHDYWPEQRDASTPSS